MSVNTCLISRCLSSASVIIRSQFIYKLQKSTTIAFSRNSLYSFYSRNPICETPPCLWISNRKYPPFLQIFSSKNPPSPSEIPKAVCGLGMDIFWNRPMLTLVHVGIFLCFIYIVIHYITPGQSEILSCSRS